MKNKNWNVSISDIQNDLYSKYKEVAKKNGIIVFGRYASIMDLNRKLFEQALKNYIKENENV